MSEAENHHDPTKQLAEVKPVTPLCGACKTSPAKLSVSPVQFGDQLFNVFFCGDCGAIFGFVSVPRQEIRLPIDHRIVGGARF